MKLLLSVTALFILLSQGISQETSDPMGNHSNVHKIIVKEVLQTSSYTYVHAEENDILKWIAVPKMPATVGETYYFQGGLEMGEFKSKELDRTFSSILFLNGLISPGIVEGGGISLNISNQITEAIEPIPEGEIDPAQGGITIAELTSNKNNYQGKIVKIKGKVTKFNSKIMSRNWIHMQDGTGNSEGIDLTATTTDEAKVGDIITIEGVIALDKDFGAGYFYSIIMENSRIVEPAK